LPAPAKSVDPAEVLYPTSVAPVAPAPAPVATPASGPLTLTLPEGSLLPPGALERMQATATSLGLAPDAAQTALAHTHAEAPAAGLTKRATTMKEEREKVPAGTALHDREFIKVTKGDVVRAPLVTTTTQEVEHPVTVRATPSRPAQSDLDTIRRTAEVPAHER